MTLSDVEPQADHNEDISGHHLSTLRIQPGDPRFQEWLVARHDFMVKQGWPSGEGNDLDVYDANPQTEQIVTYNTQRELVVGMRLTPITSLAGSLSWRMVESSSIHQQAIAHPVLTHTQKAWDLTRLVPGEGANFRSSFTAIPQLFGEGLRRCIADGDPNPLWIFVINDTMSRWLKKQGIEITVLGKDTVGSDEEASTFGAIEPAKIATLKDQLDFATRAMGDEI